MQKVAGKLSVLIPAYNEGSRIRVNALHTAELIADIAEEYEIIIINDGSADQTLNEALSINDDHFRVIDGVFNRGKGASLRLGTEAANGDYIAFCDADLDISPVHLRSFFEMMEAHHADAVIGSKMHKESKVNYPWIRRVYSWGYYLLLRVLFNLKTKDTQTGLKLFRAPVIKSVMEGVKTNGFAFDVEALSIISIFGGTIISAPIVVTFNRESFGRVGLKDVWNMLIDTLEIFWRLRIKKVYSNMEQLERR
jgi:glycosyltransferase involved in cell wall biosynthesis